MHTNQMRTNVIASMMVFCLACVAMAADAPPPGGIKLLDGYVHEKLQGIDSIVGRIVKKEGITINYEIGRVPKPGGFALGGDFSNAFERLAKDDVKWKREQTVSGQLMQVALTKKDMLIITFPKLGTNFNTTIKSMDDLGDTLMMLMTYPEGRKPPTDVPKDSLKVPDPPKVPSVPKVPSTPKPPKIPTIP